MGGTVNAAEAAVRNAQGSAQGAAAEQKQGVLDGRQVSVQAEAEANPALRGSPEAGAGDTAERKSLDSRQATTVSPTLPATESATGTSPGGQTGEPPATSATAAPIGSAAASTNPTDRLAQILAPPDLEPIVLTNAQGVTLFKGVRHGMLDADGLDLPLLNSLPNNQLLSLLLRMHPMVRQTPSSYVQSRTARRHAKEIRATDSSEAESHLEFLQHGVRRHLTDEVAAAALAMDLQKCERALDRETVDLHLCAVSLTGPEAKGVLKQQAEDLESLTRENPLEPGLQDLSRVEFLGVESPDFRSHTLRLRDRDGVQQAVLAKISVRQFALSSAGESIDPFKVCGKLNRQKDQLAQLLGPIGGNRLTGDAGAQADAIDARALRGFVPPLSRAFGPLQAAPDDGAHDNGADHAELQQLRNALADSHKSIETEMKSLTANSRTLVEAGAQLKAIWAERGDWPPGPLAHLRAAALIAFVAHHMGETPLLISGDKDVAERLEAEVKYLATYADSHEGHLPPFDSRVQE